MNIFSTKRDIMNPSEVLFTRLIHSTSTVETFLKNANIDEEDIMEILYATEEIVSIDSNFGHIKWKDYDPNPNKNKSNKGRKAQQKPKAKRKHPGDGSSFNSSIQLTIIGSCVREKSDVPDTRSIKGYVNIEDLENNREKIIKYYKIKLYRTGRISVPGSLLEDLSDVIEPLDILCRYLHDVTNLNVYRTYLVAIMKNYKFQLRGYHIDMRALQNYFAAQYEKVKLVRFEDIRKFVISPAFTDFDAYPLEGGWGKFIRNLDVDTWSENYDIDYTAMESYLRHSHNPKNMFVLMDDLQEGLDKMDLPALYQKTIEFAKNVKKRYGYELGDRIIKKIIESRVSARLTLLQKKLKESKNNDISGFRYNPERNQVFIIRIKPMKKIRGTSAVPSVSGTTGTPDTPGTPDVPVEKDGDKKKKDSNITIKLYPSGKINIDNAKSHEEAAYVYYWLNDLFLNNEDLKYDPKIHIDDLDPDDEWSYTEDPDAEAAEAAAEVVDAEADADETGETDETGEEAED